MRPHEVPPLILWLDLESTGIPDTEADVLEVACLLTDRNLEEIGIPFERVLPWPESWWSDLDPFVLNMHKGSGLYDACVTEAQDHAIHEYAEYEAELEDAESDLIHWMRSLGVTGTLPLAGSGVIAFDRPLVRRVMPELNRYLTYWSYDVGAFRRVAELAGQTDLATTPPPPTDLEDQREHRALYDVRWALADARHYRDRLRSAVF